MRHFSKRRIALLSIAALAAAAAVAATLGLVTSAGKAASAAAPVNTALPTISGNPFEGSTLTGDRGTWTGTEPITYAYRWRRCDKQGNGCGNIGGATNTTYTLRHADVGQTIRFRVTATNSSGSTVATSAQTAVVQTAPATGCPPGSGPVSVTQVNSPARLVIDQIQYSPSKLSRASTKQFTARFHISNTCGQSVSGALVYANGVPFNQVRGIEVPSASDGWATFNFQMLSGFPVNHKQGLLVFIVRARKSGENLLTGISNRRFVSVRVGA
jgi:hypothetical protein